MASRLGGGVFNPPSSVFWHPDRALRSAHSKTSSSNRMGKGAGRGRAILGAENVSEAMTNQLCFHGFATGRRQRREEKVAVIQFKLP